MRHFKRLQKLEEKSEKIDADEINEELCLWMELNPPEHITIDPNSYEEWTKTIPLHLYDSYIRWSENIRAYVQYFEKHIYSHHAKSERSQEPLLNLNKTECLPQEEPIPNALREHSDLDILFKR